MPWEERAKKIEKKRRRMVVQGRGLITVDPHAASKRLQRLRNQPGRKGARKNS